MHRFKTQVTTLIIALLTFVFIVPTTISAVTLPSIDITKARGTVLNADGKPVKFAKVYGKCGDEDSKTLGNSKGQFTLLFVSKGSCNEGDTVFVTVEGEEGNTYHGNGIVVMKKDGKIVDINFAQLSFAVFNVPEYNQFTGLIALVASVGAYSLFSRKIQLVKSFTSFIRKI